MHIFWFSNCVCRNKFYQFGALAEIKENIIITGSAYEQGSCFPSALHINGQSIDTKYIRKVNNSSNWNKDRAFVKALYKFHFTIFRIGTLMYKSNFAGLKRTVDGKGLHDTHLHSEAFNFASIKKVTYWIDKNIINFGYRSR